jgi:hypothetical protein
VGLAHRDRELACPDPIELAEARIAVALRIAHDVLVPEDRQRDVLALELAMDARPIGLDLTPVALLGAGIGEQPRLEHGIGQFLGVSPTPAKVPLSTYCGGPRWNCSCFGFPNAHFRRSEAFLLQFGKP